MATQDQHDDIPEYSEDEMGITGIRGDLKEMLNPIELEMYEEWRLDFSRWAYDRGKDPYFGEGYSSKSMYNILNRVEKFVAWQFNESGFTTRFTEEMLDDYWHRNLMRSDIQIKSCRREINNVALVIKYQGGEYSIPESKRVYRKINENSSTGVTDWFTTRELEAIKTASLRLYAVPSRDDLSSAEMDDWASKLSQRLGVRKADLTDFDWANSYKIPSLVYVSRDVGFRPAEVQESVMSWLRLDDDNDGRLSIPKSQDSKSGKNNWTCYLSRDTVRVLKMWTKERAKDSMYKDSESIWLTREGNPYSSTSLRRINQKLMDEAGIDRTNREQGWYMIRRGVGTEIGNAEGLGAVMSQLRINRIETARKYVKTDEPSIRNWITNR